MLAIGRFITSELVLVVMLKMLPAVPVETLLMLLTEPKPKEEVAMEERFLLESAKTKEEAVRVEMLRLPRLSMLTKLAPLPFWKEAMAAVWVEVALTTRVGVVEGPMKFWTKSKAVGEVVPMPMLPEASITIGKRPPTFPAFA